MQDSDDDDGMTDGSPKPAASTILPFNKPPAGNISWSSSSTTAIAHRREDRNNRRNDSEQNNNNTTAENDSAEAKLALLKAKIEGKKKRLQEKMKREAALNADAPSFVPLALRNAERFDTSRSSNTRSQLPADLQSATTEEAGNNSFRNSAAGRENLENAKTLVGTCEHMCPDEEILRREREGDIQLLEKPEHTTLHPAHWTLRDTMVKRFRRSAADFKLDVPEWVRPPDVLERVCGYLEEWVMVSSTIVVGCAAKVALQSWNCCSLTKFIAHVAAIAGVYVGERSAGSRSTVQKQCYATATGRISVHLGPHADGPQRLYPTELCRNRWPVRRSSRPMSRANCAVALHV
jgi:hypothetical protein